MVERIEGGIREHQDLIPFTAIQSDVPVKDQIDLMARCWFALNGKRTEPIEHEYIDRRTKHVENVRITGSPEHGIATIHDQDLIIFIISHWNEAKRRNMELSRRVNFKPYQFFAWIGRKPGGSAYQRLKEALNRLKTTNVQTTFSFNNGQRLRKQKQFSWISECEIREEDGRICGVEVVLAEWLFESVKNYQVLTLPKSYFDITSGIERWLAQYARKATGGENGTWKESFKSLHKKSATQQEYKHYASELRKIIKKNTLPGIALNQSKSMTGLDMLVMERVEKRNPVEAKQEEQLLLIERTLDEENWENTVEILCREIGEGTAKAWIRPIEFQGYQEGVLKLRLASKFIADHVESHYCPRIRAAWESVGEPVKRIHLDVRKAI